jgi:arylsulfatase A-like enzyme
MGETRLWRLLLPARNRNGRVEISAFGGLDCFLMGARIETEGGGHQSGCASLPAIMTERLLDQRWPWLLAAAAIVILFLSSLIEIRRPGQDSRPRGSVEDIERLHTRSDLNVLFIMIDTLRADRLGSYGYERDTSPTLDRLASSGVRFARQLAQSSWTKTSMASLWTGLVPVRTGVTRFDHVLRDEALLPAEVLRGAGFRTVGLYRNGWVAPTFGFDQGFDVYQRPLGLPLPPNIKRQNPTLSEHGSDEGLVSSALEFLRLQGDERWFLYLHMMDVHEYLYDEESALFGLAYSDIYDNSIRWTDGVLEVLLAHLAELGHLDDTLIVIASDHGEAFGERGFEGHARRVYRETTEVPLILSFPFRLDPGIVVETRTSNIDIWPTVLDLLGLELPGADGRSRLPEIVASGRGVQARTDDAPSIDSDRDIASEEPGIAHLDMSWARPTESSEQTVAVAQGPLRYVRVEQAQSSRQPHPAVVEQLFDARHDPRELRNRASQEPEALARLAAEADRYLELRPDWGEALRREISELELNHLRALGYAIP